MSADEQKFSHAQTPRPVVPSSFVPRVPSSFSTVPLIPIHGSNSIPVTSPTNSTDSFTMVNNDSTSIDSNRLAALEQRLSEMTPLFNRMERVMTTFEAKVSRIERENTDINVNPRRGSNGDRRGSMKGLVPNTPFQRTMILEGNEQELDNISNNVQNTPNRSDAYVPVRGIKFDPPDKYSGNHNTTAISLLMWCNQMESYLDAVQVPYDSKQSLSVAVLRLQDMAFIWYISIKNREEKEVENGTRESYSINCWYDLKKAMKDRYVPQQQQQISMNRLLGVRFNGSVDSYNQRFSNELMLLPELSDPNMEQFVMSIYARGMCGHGSEYFSHIIQQALSKGEINNIYNLMDMVRLSEQAQKMAKENSSGRDSSRNAILSSTANKHSSHYKSNRSGNNFRSYSNNKSYSNRSHDKSNWRPNSNTPFKPQALNFSTPAKLNHMDMFDEYGTDIDIDENDYRENDNDDSYYQDETQNGIDARSDNNDSDSGQHTDSNADEDNSFLNAVRIFENVKKVVPSITPEELDSRRRNGTCFRCNKEGHFANKCPLRISKKNHDKNKKNF